MSSQSTEITHQQSSPLAMLSRQIESRQEEYRKALPSHIKPEDLQRTVVMAAQQNPKLLEADRRTLMLSCMKAAQDGLLPDGREAALVPFKVWDPTTRQSRAEVQYMPMVYGLRKKIIQSDQISTMTVGVVYRSEYEAQRFIFELGMEPPIRHRPDLTLSGDDIADDKIVAAYSLVKFKDGSFSAEVMRRAEIDKIRELSQTGATRDRKGQPRTAKGPWVDHFGEQCKKTVMRRHSKVLPMSGDIFRDVEGAEQELAIQSATQILDAVDEAEPKSLPTKQETEQFLDDEIPAFDKDTGEAPATETSAPGKTAPNEDSARETGSVDGDAGGQGGNEFDPQAKRLADIRDGINGAIEMPEINAIDKEWEKHMVAYPDDVQSEINKAIADKRSAIRDAAEGQSGNV